ncbi:MAG TPA: response regulator [Verrucomicrobiae bacterium]|nr:response regulator [Verrucomicrobiae bacterium]
MSTLLARSEFPFAPARESAASVNRVPARPVTHGEKRARVLYVDDEPGLLRLGALVLSRAGYEVDTAADGVAAWSALRERSYQLLITDNQMPGMTGVELIRKLGLEGPPLPAILASGTLGLLPKSDLPWLDQTTLLAKPFSAEQLLEAVHNALLAAPAEMRPVGLNSLVPDVAASRHESWNRWGLNE